MAEEHATGPRTIWTNGSKAKDGRTGGVILAYDPELGPLERRFVEKRS